MKVFTVIFLAKMFRMSESREMKPRATKMHHPPLRILGCPPVIRQLKQSPQTRVIQQNQKLLFPKMVFTSIKMVFDL